VVPGPRRKATSREMLSDGLARVRCAFVLEAAPELSVLVVKR